MSPAPCRIGLLGFGTVGSAVARRLVRDPVPNLRSRTSSIAARRTSAGLEAENAENLENLRTARTLRTPA